MMRAMSGGLGTGTDTRAAASIRKVDTEASVYCYSFDKELLRSWRWSERYPQQPEVLAYLNFVATKHDLRRSVNFNTRVVKAEWNEESSAWKLTTGNGKRYALK